MYNNILKCEGGFKKIIVGLVSLLIISLTLSTFTNFLGNIKTEREALSVTGTGEVSAAPDMALISFSVVTEEDTVASAMNSNSEKMNAVTEEIKGLGVEEKDIKTTGFNLYPRYNYTDKLMYSSERVLAGYEVRNTITVKVRDLSILSSVIEKATEKGANYSENLQFTFQDEEALKAQAREEAITKARTKADQIAKQLGSKVKGVISFNESYYSSARSYNLASGLGGVSEDAVMAPTISTGENTISVTVNINYEI
jgi:uncharacterized protein YggE